MKSQNYRIARTANELANENRQKPQILNGLIKVVCILRNLAT